MKKIYSAYALTLFAILLILALIPYMLVKLFIPHQGQIKFIYKINSLVMRVWSSLTGFRFEVQNENLVDRGATYIVVINHYSILDMLTIAHSLAVPAKPLIKKELLNIPILGWLFSMAAIPVDRSKKSSRTRSFNDMIDQLEKEVSILIFPEGTRNRGSQPLKDFKKGAFRLSVETGYNILPVVLLNLRNHSNVDSLSISPATMTLRYLEPIDPLEANRDPEILKRICYERMESEILSNDPWFQTN